MQQRAAVVGKDRKELLTALRAIAKAKPSPDTFLTSARPGRLAYLLSGQGSQRAGMGKELYETHPPYKEALDQICEQIDPHLDLALKDLLFSEPGSKQAALLDHTTYAQPALFATGLALHHTLLSFGLKPQLLAGHSVGEIAAAQIAGVLDLADAAKLICARSRLMGELPEEGAMLAIEATEQEAAQYLKGKEQALSIAAINGPSSVVLSGEREAIDQAEAHWQERGKKTKRLSVSHAFHSPLIEPMLERFGEEISGLDFKAPEIPILSNTTGELLTPEQATDPAYWVAHARQPVRFADALKTLKEQGASACLELGPGGVLAAIAQEALGAEAIPTLREQRGEGRSLALAFASALAAGAKPDWSTFFKDTKARAVPLPTYPFQRKRYWLNPSSGGSDPSALGLSSTEHPFLGAQIEDMQGDGLTFSGRISLQSHPWLADHAVGGHRPLPRHRLPRAGSAGGAGARLRAPERAGPAGAAGDPRDGRRLAAGARGGSWRGGRARGLDPHPPRGRGGRVELSRAGVALSQPQEGQLPQAPEAWPPQGAEPLELDGLYQRLGEIGLEYGPAFQGLTAAWKLGDEIYAEVSLDGEQASEARSLRASTRPCSTPPSTPARPRLRVPVPEEERTGPALPWRGVERGGRGSGVLRARLAVSGRASPSPPSTEAAPRSWRWPRCSARRLESTAAARGPDAAALRLSLAGSEPASEEDAPSQARGSGAARPRRPPFEHGADAAGERPWPPLTAALERLRSGSRRRRTRTAPGLA